MPKVSTKSLRSLVSNANPSILNGAITESADYIEELEHKIELLQMDMDLLQQEKNALLGDLGRSRTMLISIKRIINE
jgi:hypothetical protein